MSDGPNRRVPSDAATAAVGHECAARRHAVELHLLLQVLQAVFHIWNKLGLQLDDEMTCRMAAVKQKKRLINSIDSDQYRPGKKTKFESSNNCLVTLSPHIGLKWDRYLRRVVPEKEQVGLLWSDLAPFVETRKRRSGLADVTYVPPEAFSFENLRSMLSYEVWATCLTEDERKFLIQFLPSETDAEENVHMASSLCYGDIHPDALLDKEKHIKAAEKAYRIDLHNYHSNMVETLKKWRKRWLSCGDTENLFSDSPAKKKQGVMQVAASKSGMALKVAQSVDVSKYMSYIEISRTQLNHIKRLKQSGDGIQTKHVSRVLGGLDNFPVKPFRALMEGEQMRLREHWLNMVRKDLPAAFEVLKDRKTLMENSAKLIGLELGEKSVSVMRKADKLSDVRKDVGQHGAFENDGSPVLQTDQVEHSPQSISQGRSDQSVSLQDQDDEKTRYKETSIYHIEGSNMKGLDPMVASVTLITSQSEQILDVLNQDHKDVKCFDVSMSCCADIPDVQNEDLIDSKLRNDGLDAQHEKITEVSYEDTAVQNCSSGNRQIKSINYTSTPIHTLDSQNMQVQDLDGIALKGPSIHAHEQDQDLKSISNAIVNHSNHGVNSPSEKRHPQMNTVIAEQEEAENILMMPSCSSSLLPKSTEKQIIVEDFLDSTDHAEGVKNRWQMAGPLQSYYHAPEDRMYNDSDYAELSLFRTTEFSVYAHNDIIGQSLTQVTTSSFPVDNSTSFVDPFSNQQRNGQLQIVKDIGTYSLQHDNGIQQSTGLHSSTNSHLVQSAPFSVQEQQLIDQSHAGLYVQQLPNNLYSGASFPNSGNPLITEQHSYDAFGPMDHRYNNWSIEGNQSHSNNLSGLALDNCLTQALPSGSNTDGSLFSAISQYRQPSGHIQPGRLSPSQLLERGDTNPSFSDIYGHTQTVISSPSSHLASAGSLNNMNWTNFIQQNPGIPDLTNRQFRGPWTR
ncbi:hypothetical protein EJB05_12806, partial [Eragrostis curvula]